MSDVATAPATAPTPATPKKAAKGKSGTATTKKPRAKPTHPKTSDMVNAAIKNLKERGGSSLQAIKKYIAANYKVDAEKMAPFIRKYLKSAVTSGSLVQTKGKGASGSFKLASAGEKPSAAKKPSKASKPAAPPKAKKSKPTTATKTAPVKKSASSAPKKAPAKPKATKKAPSGSSKAKKTTKAPTQKPKAPKPKKVSAAKSPKKAAAKKK